MEVIDIVPKDISIVTAFSLKEIEALLFCMEKTSLTYDQDDPEQAEKVEYFVGKFHQTLCSIEEKIKDVS